MPNVISNISIEDAKIGFRNFSGKEGDYNTKGNRNFCVFLDAERAQALQEEGWNIRWLRAKDPQEADQGYLQVAVNFANIPPRILLISSRGKTVITEESASLLDWAEIESVDLLIRPYNWVMYEGKPTEKRGVKAYVKSMYVVIHEDEFEKKYSNVPDSAADTIGGCGHCEECDGSCKGHGN